MPIAANTYFEALEIFAALTAVAYESKCRLESAYMPFDGDAVLASIERAIQRIEFTRAGGIWRFGAIAVDDWKSYETIGGWLQSDHVYVGPVPKIAA